MSLLRGPTRLVLLRSGGYDYAELELHSPVHLVAANNVGKTTLIAALQFLYIDDAQEMHFSHDWTKTRKHYFPKLGSAILFECMTPTGFQVFGLRGLGPVQGYDYERFVYAGPYQRDDFVDGQTVRAWDDDVVHRLVGRSLRFLEPRNLRASLLGSGDEKGPYLGLVPLKRSSNYNSFRFLFRNLLRLSKIEQKHLKRLFIDITRPRLRQVKLDLRRDYATLFARVERQSADAAALRRVAPMIKELLECHAERDAVRSQLVRLWAAIEGTLEEERERNKEARLDLANRTDEIKRQQDELERKDGRLAELASQVDQRLGACRENVARLEMLRDRVSDFVEELEAATRRGLVSQRNVVVARIAQATTVRREDVEERLAKLRAELTRDTSVVEHFSDVAITWLRTASGLDDSQLADVFRLLHPSLLAAVIGEGGVAIEDEEELRRSVVAIGRGFDRSGFYGAGAFLPRAALPGEDEIVKYQDLGAVQQRIARSREMEAELVQTLGDIDARLELEQTRDELERQLAEADERLRDWRAWREGEPQLVALGSEVEQLQEQAADHAVQRRVVGEELRKLAGDERDLEAEGKALKDKLQRIESDIRNLERPPSDWRNDAAAGAEDATGVGIRTLVERYGSCFGEQLRLARKVDRLFGDVEHETAGRHVGTTEAETMARLRDEVDALPDRESAVKELWTSLVDGMRSAFKALIEGVDEIRREVSRLTQALGRRQISNLERVELELVKQRELLQRLEAVVETEEAPLFAGPQGRSRAAQEIATWLTDRPRIDLSELFDLRFEIVDRTGEKKTFESLRQIESEGTSTTIKVLVHLELLRTMLADDAVSVPFFLDEVAALDPPNLRGLIDHATAMAFVPVVASPEARDCVDRLYYLRPGTAGLVLDETCRIAVHRKESSNES